MLSLIAIAFLLKRFATHAVPLPVPAAPSSTFDTPIFARDDPSDGCHSRTVLDILWSCLATTFACTWVSVHPNVPFKGEGKWTLLGRRIFLMFFSILAPELMIVWAFKQWRGAVMIREAMNEASEQAFPGTKDPRRNSWTTTHGHLLQMGGFRISCIQHESNLFDSWRVRNQRFYRRETSEGTWTTDSLPNYRNNMTLNDKTIWEGALSFDVLQQLLTDKLIRFPTITEDEISDRSKGDALSKGVALLQLTWFIVQIITRAAQGLVITELELTTAALAGLNSVMYIFWWSKPRDVRFPVVIRTKVVEKSLAERIEDAVGKFPNPKEFDFRGHLWTSMTTPIKNCLSALRKFLVSFPTKIKNMLSDFAGVINVLASHLYPFLSRSYQHFTRAKGAKSGDSQRTGVKESSDAGADADPELQSAKENMACMQKIYGALTCSAKAVIYFFAFLFSLLAYAINFGLFIPMRRIMQSNEDDDAIPMLFDENELVRLFFMMFYSEDAEQKPLFRTASISGALFGGVHCLAWHFSFPSHAEQIMWRTASLGIVGACTLLFVGTFLWNDDFYDTRYNEADEILCVLGYACLAILQIISFLLIAVVYPVFRLMLLVLAVTSLRSLPPSAFDTVQWIEFVPHI